MGELVRPLVSVHRLVLLLPDVYRLSRIATRPTLVRQAEHLEYAPFCQSKMTAPSQGLNQADQQQTAGDPEAWSGQHS